MALLSYHGRSELKDERLAIVAKHRELDLLQQGATGTPSQGQKGCAVACTVDGYQHSRYPVELGIPKAWALLEDSIFEGLSVEDAQQWATQFLEAVPVGVDLFVPLHRVVSRIMLEICLPAAQAVEPEESMLAVDEAVRSVVALHDQAARGDIPSPMRAWQTAWSEEIAKHGSAAWSAAWSAAESAARSAAWSAAESAARSAAWSAAESAAWTQIRDIALEELRTARTPSGGEA